MAGISRSVTLILAYLIKCLNKTFDEAYHFMKVKRKIVVISVTVDAPKLIIPIPASNILILNS
jgi:protein-tyrosine phosphatase